ncbi:hypothetical protein EV356DRAFT_496693 [Viridothelium virens]|uniref:Major royal jelly protein n=1 Tax=Viridothelium virens TaxID=1048519 RepID=A0A6A6HGS6_VIRVR|nr:hypothetical protein EV356DRAFT_496693 [Viridothelium virens]
MMLLGTLLTLLTAATAAQDCLFPVCPPYQGASCEDNSTVPYSSPDSFTIIGPPLQAVHQSVQPPTGLALDNAKNLYLTYPRNTGLTPSQVTIAKSFTDEEPWPNADIQNCTAGQDPSTCFINVQNVVLDSQNVMWAIDSGINYTNPNMAIPGGAKIMAFNLSTNASLIRTYTIPTALLANGTNANDVRINNTLGTGGFAFLTDESKGGGILACNLTDGTWTKRLYNTSVVMADPGYVGSYDGQPVYSWNGTTKSFINTGSDGIALQSGNVYWGVLASRRFYYVPQSVMADFSLSDQEVLNAVVFPGQLGSEQAGLTADDKGRLYITGSEQNAIYYVDTLQQYVNETVNGTPPGGSGLVEPDNYVVKTLVRSGLIQHADSAAILDGCLYFCTNQLEYSPSRQYNNTDKRKGPFGSYRLYIGAGPAV